MEDLVSIWLERIDRSSDRYKDNNFVKKMVSDIENLVDKEDDERHDRENEIEQMSNEDSRLKYLNSHDIFDMDPNFNLSILFGEN